MKRFFEFKTPDGKSIILDVTNISVVRLDATGVSVQFRGSYDTEQTIRLALDQYKILKDVLQTLGTSENTNKKTIL